MSSRWPWLAVVLLACAREPADTRPPVDTRDETDTPAEPPASTEPPPAVMRRLTVREYDATLRDLLDDRTGWGAVYLPADPFLPFDNVVSAQEPSDAFVAGAERAAVAAAAALRADAERMRRVMRCEPAGPGDADCLRTFIEQFGRRVIRRPLSAEDRDAWVELALLEAAETGDALDGAARVVSGLLQRLDFLYRVNEGAPLEADPTQMRLDGYAIASELSYLIVGAGPDDAALADAASGALDLPNGRVALARRLLADPRAAQHLVDLHAAWFGYRQIPEIANIAEHLRAEADALVRRVLFEDQAPWTDLWTAPYAWLRAEDAEAYGVPPTGIVGDAPGWVDLTGTGRAGLLSQGAFLSVGNNPLDTSPTKRGVHIARRLMCAPIGAPPANVVTDVPPAGEAGSCKVDRYAAHRADPGCAACHATVDGIGLGLEAYDRVGRPRAFEIDPLLGDPVPGCPVVPGGEVPELGAFGDAAELAALLVDAELVQACAVRHIVAFAKGQEIPPSSGTDVLALTDQFAASGWSLHALIEALAASDALVVTEVDP